jgi:glucokinase
LPDLNKRVAEVGNPRRYRNLFGATFGTGFGGGIVTRHGLLFGDNSAGGEINRVRNKIFRQFDVEESVSIRGLRREYAHNAGINTASAPEPKEIFEIGTGKRAGNREAAIRAFDAFAEAAADALANALTLVDGLVVIGGGLSGAWPLFMPGLVREMNQPYQTTSGELLDRLEITVFNLEDGKGMEEFLKPSAHRIPVPFSTRETIYDPIKKTGVGISRLGTSKAVSVGAYAYALAALGK